MFSLSHCHIGLMLMGLGWVGAMNPLAWVWASSTRSTFSRTQSLERFRLVRPPDERAADQSIHLLEQPRVLFDPFVESPKLIRPQEVEQGWSWSPGLGWMGTRDSLFQGLLQRDPRALMRETKISLDFTLQL